MRVQPTITASTTVVAIGLVCIIESVRPIHGQVSECNKALKFESPIDPHIYVI